MKIFNTLRNSSIEFLALIFIILVLGLKSIAQNRDSSEALDYSTWTDLLQKHVSRKGEVDYVGFKDDQKILKTFTEQFSQHSIENNWSDNQKKAYLINAYNAFTILLIIENYPINSIKNIGENPFDAFKNDFIKLGGKMVSLDDIEKGMLLPMGDARVHFAVNCASYSCPRLYNKAYVPEKLDEQLSMAASRFINSDLNIIKNNEVKLSKLFDWYKSDFENDSQSVIDFINRFSATKINQNLKIEYLEYDWNLNSHE